MFDHRVPHVARARSRQRARPARTPPAAAPCRRATRTHVRACTSSPRYSITQHATGPRPCRVQLARATDLHLGDQLAAAALPASRPAARSGLAWPPRGAGPSARRAAGRPRGSPTAGPGRTSAQPVHRLQRVEHLPAGHRHRVERLVDVARAATSISHRPTSWPSRPRRRAPRPSPRRRASRPAAAIALQLARSSCCSRRSPARVTRTVVSSFGTSSTATAGRRSNFRLRVACW